MDLIIFILFLGHSRRIKVELFTYIYASSLDHSRGIKEKTFVRDTRNKFQLHITLFTKYLTLYNN